MFAVRAALQRAGFRLVTVRLRSLGKPFTASSGMQCLPRAAKWPPSLSSPVFRTFKPLRSNRGCHSPAMPTAPITRRRQCGYAARTRSDFHCRPLEHCFKHRRSQTGSDRQGCLLSRPPRSPLRGPAGYTDPRTLGTGWGGVVWPRAASLLSIRRLNFAPARHAATVR